MDDDPRKVADAKSRGAGLLAVVGGLALTGLTWRWAWADGRYDLKMAVIGPLVGVLGVGFLIHGAEMPLDGVTTRTRQFGLLGSVAGIANLYFLGFFHKPHESPVSSLLALAVPLVLIGVWFLPDRFFGGPGHVPPKPPNTPIEPR
jgi:hypothetical protein